MLNEKIDFNGLPVKLEISNIKEHPLHWHEHHQLLLVLEGEIELFLSVKRHRVSKDNVFFIHRKDVHSIKSLSKDNIILTLSIDDDYGTNRNSNWKTDIFSTNLEKQSTHSDKLHKILLEGMLSVVSIYADTGVKKQNHLEIAANNLISILYKYFKGIYLDEQVGPSVHNLPIDPLQAERINRITSHMYEKYYEPLTLTEFADQEHISKYYLSHSFQQASGVSFRTYLANIRVEESLRYVLSSDMSLTKIALESGFSNYVYYKKHFIKLYKMDPADYRDTYKKETILYKPVIADDIAFSDISDLLYSLADYPPLDEDFLRFENRFDFAKDSPTQYKDTLSISVIISNNDRINPDEYSPAYDSYNFNKNLEVLSKMLAVKKFDFAMFDSHSSLYGMLLGNETPKPLYYVYNYLKTMEGAVRITNEAILNKYGDSSRLLFINNTKQEQYLDILMKQELKNYKIALQSINAENDVVLCLKKINFAALTPSEKEMIIDLSKPSQELFIENSLKKELLLTVKPYSVIMITLEYIQCCDQHK